MANNLFLDAELLENDLREIIKKSVNDKDIIDTFGEVHLIPEDSDSNSNTVFPAIYIYITKNGPYAPAQEDTEVEPYSRFSVTVETYTTGSNRRSLNRKLAQFMIYILQTNQQLSHYYNRGLKLDQERELSAFVDDVNRIVIRFSGVVDNASKLIYNKEM